MEDDLALVRRNGWSRRHGGKLHSRGWWYHPGWNWLPFGQAVTLSRDQEDRARLTREQTVEFWSRQVSDIEAELEGAREKLREAMTR